MRCYVHHGCHEDTSTTMTFMKILGSPWQPWTYGYQSIHEDTLVTMTFRKIVCTTWQPWRYQIDLVTMATKKIFGYHNLHEDTLVTMANMQILWYPLQPWEYFGCCGNCKFLVAMATTKILGWQPWRYFGIHSNHGNTLVAMAILNSWLLWQPQRYSVATDANMKILLKFCRSICNYFVTFKLYLNFLFKS